MLERIGGVGGAVSDEGLHLYRYRGPPKSDHEIEFSARHQQIPGDDGGPMSLQEFGGEAFAEASHPEGMPGSLR